jgi:REP element-mobilizing transposase RayT
MARGNNGQTVFGSDKDYEAFLDQLRVVRGRYPFYLYDYVLMPNHFHLLLEVRESPTARIMQLLDVLMHQAARENGVDPQAALGGGRTRLLGEIRRRFIEAAVLEQGYLRAEVAVFLGCHATNVTRALQRAAKIK